MNIMGRTYLNQALFAKNSTCAGNIILYIMVVSKLEKVSPIFPTVLQKIGEVWRNLEKFGEVWRVFWGKSGRFPITDDKMHIHPECVASERTRPNTGDNMRIHPGCVTSVNTQINQLVVSQPRLRMNRLVSRPRLRLK